MESTAQISAQGNRRFDNRLRYDRARSLWKSPGVACGVFLAIAMSIYTANAQFVGAGSPTGAEAQDGQGANAAGDTRNTAVGPSANASGTSGANTAVGTNA